MWKLSLAVVLVSLASPALGRMIEARAREQGVDAHVEWTADARAGLYFAELDAGSRARNVLYDRAGSAISMVTPGTIDWASVFTGARWYHSTTLYRRTVIASIER